jgi:rhodanese-related sulfurtransferase
MFHRRSVLLTAALTAVLLGGAPVGAQSQAVPQVPLIEPATLHTYLQAGMKVHLVDVRTPEEFNQGHIAGAVLMPLDTLPSSYASLPKTGKLVVYCRSGHRSAKAVQFLMEHGYKNAVSLNGGYIAWSAAQH